LQDADSRTRQAAAKALGEIGDPRAAESLVAALRDHYQVVRRSAMRGLGVFWQLQDVSSLADDDPNVRQAAARALGELGDVRAVGPLIAALKDEDSRTHKAAAKALGEIGDPAIERLIAALEDKDPPTREAAARALGELGDARAVDPLIAALENEDSGTRRAAAKALGEIGDPRAAVPLAVALFDKDEVVTFWSRHGPLIRIGEAAVEPLTAALGDKNQDIRAAAAEALRKIKKPRAQAALDEWEQKQKADQSSGQLQ
jgi:HEAT repeat protein